MDSGGELNVYGGEFKDLAEYQNVKIEKVDETLTMLPPEEVKIQLPSDPKI